MVDILKSNCNLIPVKVLKQHWTQPKFSYIKKPRPNHGIMLLINGEIEFASLTETLSAKSGDVIFLPQGSYYEAKFRIDLGEIDNYLINFKSDEKVSDCTKPTLIAEDVSFSCFEQFKQFVEENYNSPSVDFRCKGMFYLLLSTILSETGDKKSSSDKVLAKAKKLLRQTDNQSVKMVARECLVSESGLRKIFKDSVGISPTQFRINEKISRAKYLLESTDMSVDEISEELNFFDTAYFCKTFYKHVGISPGKYSRNKKL